MKHIVSEEITKMLDDKLLRQILTKLETMDVRLQFVEGKIRERGFDTKPIWEKALAEIMEVKQYIAGVDRKIDVLGGDILNVRADYLKIERRVERLEDDAARGAVEVVN